MIKQEHVYRMKNKRLEEIIVGIVVFGFLAFASFSAQKHLVTLFFIPLLVFCIVALMRFFHDEIKITDTKLIVTRYFRTKEIAWRDISFLETKMTGFLLGDINRDVKVFISAELMNLWKFVKTVKKYRPDLLQPTKTTFRENPILAWVIGAVGIFFIYYSARQVIASFDNLFLKTFIALFGLGFVLLAVFLLKSFTFDKDKLIVRTLARERTIYLDGLDFSSVSNKSILIISKDGYSISVENLVEGVPSFLITFQAWLQSGSGDFYETIQGIS